MPRAHKTPPKHGLQSLMGRVTARGMQAIDRRSVAYRAVKEWQAKMIDALGGEQMLSAQRLSLIELAARTKLFLDHVDAYLLGLTTLINRRRKSLIPIVEQRQRLADSLARQLQTLGLDRVERDGGSIPAEWITKVEPHHEEPEQHNDEQPDPAPADEVTHDEARHDTTVKVRR